MERDIKKLEEMSKQIRKDIITMIYEGGDGHPGPSLSVADIVTTLYFEVMNIDSKNPKKKDRDRFILSKGHACPALYAALGRKGFFECEQYPTLRCINSKLQGHPDMNKTPGVDSTSGSLGNGISVATGVAIGSKLSGLDYYTYVATGDGELEEGVVWEALMSAKHHKLGKLIVFIDNNGKQSGGSVDNVSGLYPILPKFESFGWHCQEIDGHNHLQILNAINEAKLHDDTPSVILAHTTKGKGVPYMENNNKWHKGVPSDEEYKIAMKALG